MKHLEKWAKLALKDYCGNTTARTMLDLVRRVKKAERRANRK